MTTTSTYQSIQQLLQFQNSFLNLVHSQILCHEQIEKRKQAMLKFHVIQISDKTEIFNQIITTLKTQLIDEKQQCDPVLKSYFLKLLELDYLPLLHINRYQLTKLAIFGFDIYIDPLEAILQILNRLQRVLYILQDCLKDQKLTNTVILIVQDKKSFSEILLQGWKPYYCFLHLHKLTLNVYMLKQYINVATTSLPKRDKQIIFTGIYNIYKRLIPILTHHHLTPQLQQLSDLNNMMYNFHGSFDYFLFYTYLQPTEQYLGVFNRIREIENKCKHTNILTPLLFGVMNNYNAFGKFVDKVEGVGYGHLLKVLLAGLIVNFKLRILEYNEVLRLIGLVINKLCLLNKMNMNIITADLPAQWQQAKQFFISAFKSGYNPGQIQAWTLCDSKTIQPTIITFLIKGLLLSPQCRNNQFIKTLSQQQLLQVLENEVKQLTDGGETLSGLMNNWKQLTITVHHTNTNTESSSKHLNIVRIINLTSLLELNSQRLVYAIISILNNNNNHLEEETIKQSQLVKLSLLQSIQTLNEIITTINRKQSLTNVKDILLQMHVKYPPKRTFEDIIPVYLHSFITREAINCLLELLVSSTHSTHSYIHIKQVLTALVHKYFTKPQQQLLNTTSSQNYETYKSFDKQYKIPIVISAIDTQPNTVYSNLVKIITTSTQTQNNNNKRKIAYDILLNLMKHSPHHIITVLNLPAMKNDKIGSFLDWLINQICQESRIFIISTLRQLNQFADKTTSSILDLRLYLDESYHLNVLDEILSSLAGLNEIDNWYENAEHVCKSLNLIDLFVQIYEQFISTSSSVNNINSIITNILSSVWMNLSDLLAYILKNAQYQILTITKCCTLYWKIIRITKRNSIDLWYHKLTINRIFSTITNQNLLFNETFKGITLISNIKNYLISKELSSQQQQTTNEKSQRYAFSDIKGFFQNNYQSISNDQNINYKNQKYFQQFFTLIQQSRSQIKPIKTQIHLISEKDIPPCLSQINIQNIYDQYCNSKVQGEENKSLEFCLLLLSLNPVNHRNLWKLMMKSQDKIFLEQMSFTRQTINQVLQVVRHLENQKENQQQNKKSSLIEVEQNLRSMLCLDLLQYSINELELLASAYYFDQSKLQAFVSHKKVLWFLIVCNNSSWRQFNEVFSTHIKNCCFLSNLLQYKEYLSITKQTNNDYEQKIDQFSQLIDQYVFFVQKKLDSIDSLKASDSEKENTIRKSTLLINIKVLLLKCDMEKILEKVSMLLKELHQNSLNDNQFRGLVASLHKLNKLCNKLLGGNIKLPNFTQHNLYTTSESDEKQFLLGTWIEKCEKGFQNHDSLLTSASLYVPQMEFYLKMDRIQAFINETKDEQTIQRKTLDTKVQTSICHNEYLKLKQNLKDYLQPGLSIIVLKHENCPSAQITLLNKFYCLGFLYFFENTKQNNQKLSEKDNFGLSQILRNLTKREKISLQVIREIDASAYHQLKVLIMNDKLSIDNKKKMQDKESDQKEEQKIPFVWNSKELLPKGLQTILNEENKDLYLQLITEEILGKSYIKLNNAFALGFINASILHKTI